MRSPATDEQRQRIIDLLSTATSLRKIAQLVDVSATSTTTIARPYIAILRATGALGLCGCGRERFHPRGCRQSSVIRNGHSTPMMIEQRSAIVSAIMTGRIYQEIAAQFGIDTSAVRKYLRFLTPAQRERRKALERARRREAAGPVTFRPVREALYRRVAASVPRGLPEHLRDDVISEMMLAVYEGLIPAGEITRHAERFARAARGAFASKWGPISLDQPRFDDSNETLAAAIPDPRALAAFDYIFEERI